MLRLCASNACEQLSMPVDLLAATSRKQWTALVACHPLLCCSTEPASPCGYLQDPPGTPRNLAVSDSGLVTFDYPVDDDGDGDEDCASPDNGGSLITHYVITVELAGVLVSTHTTTEPNLYSHQLHGLTVGKTYDISLVRWRCCRRRHRRHVLCSCVTAAARHYT